MMTGPEKPVRLRFMSLTCTLIPFNAGFPSFSFEHCSSLQSCYSNNFSSILSVMKTIVVPTQFTLSVGMLNLMVHLVYGKIADT